ncbi:MAG: cbb3-type cytochrome c oxidase N-terminal domain-containing protein [Planctomycetota bacterium]
MSDATHTPDTKTPASDPHEAEILDHNYDGIQEYDNPLPGWWKALFLATFLFSLAYLAFLTPFSVAREFEHEDADLKERAASANLLEGISNEGLEALSQDAAAMAAAKEKFLAVCASCHGDQGQGKIGPNLTDDHWIHCKQTTDIYLTIYRGVEAKGMIAWGKSLKPDEIQRLAAYVQSLRGSNPPNPRAPEGDVHEF